MRSGRNVEDISKKQLKIPFLPAVREADDNNEIGAVRVRRKGAAARLPSISRDE
jgi:hypothetical protein